MATDNETVDEIVKDMRSQFPPKYCSSKSCRIEVDQPVRKFATRIESAHKREVAELKTAYDRAVSADARHAVENERLKGEVTELRECLRIIRDNLVLHTIKSADGNYVNNGAFLSEEFVDDERWRKALEGGAK